MLVCAFYPGSQRQVVHVGVVKVPLGEVRVHLAQEVVSAKRVMVPHRENQRLGPEIIAADAILKKHVGAND